VGGPFVSRIIVDQSPPLPAGIPAFDPSALDRLKRFGGDKLLREMIALFLSAAPERIAAARAATEQSDAAAAERALHLLKSSAAQLGAMHMQRLSEQGEQRARAGSTDGLRQVVQDLERELTSVREWLTRTRDEGLA
jgi:HPt (histidine-containing phosphotransfer) domain-containing protein